MDRKRRRRRRILSSSWQVPQANREVPENPRDRVFRVVVPDFLSGGPDFSKPIPVADWPFRQSPLGGAQCDLRGTNPLAWSRREGDRHVSDGRIFRAEDRKTSGIAARSRDPGRYRTWVSRRRRKDRRALAPPHDGRRGLARTGIIPPDKRNDSSPPFVSGGIRGVPARPSGSASLSNGAQMAV